MAMLLTAVDEGLGALFFGIFERAGRTLRAAFGIPDDFHPIGAVALGWPAPDEPSPSLRRGRRPRTRSSTAATGDGVTAIVA